MARRRTREAKSLAEVAGTRIRALREEQGLIRARLAELAGVSLTSLSLLETGKTQPALKTLEALANALGVRVVDLLDDRRRPTKPVAGTNAYFRTVKLLRGRSDAELVAIQRLIEALDRTAQRVAEK